MRKLVFAIILLLLTLPFYAEEIDTTFRFLQINYICMNYADLAFTYSCLAKYENVKELNPIANFYLKNPAITIAVTTSWNYFSYWGTTQIYKENKIWGYVTIIAMNLGYAYVMYHNFKEIK